MPDMNKGLEETGLAIKGAETSPWTCRETPHLLWATDCSTPEYQENVLFSSKPSK